MSAALSITTAVRSSLALAVLIAGLAGCGGTSRPIDDDGAASSSEDTGSTPPPPSDGPSSPPDPSAPADESTGPDDPPDGSTGVVIGSTGGDATSGAPSDDTTTTGDSGAVGWCAYTCTVDAECPPQEGLSPFIACIDGFCQYGEPPACDATLCPADLGMECSFVDGLSFCVLSCSLGGDECSAFPMFDCTGVDDFGGPFCEPWPCWGAPEGGPCVVPGAGNYGICANGECVCNEDAQCTVAGTACNT